MSRRGQKARQLWRAFLCDRRTSMTLQAFFQAHPRAALAFSGGVDSAYLLWAGKHWGCDLTAYYDDLNVSAGGLVRVIVAVPR